MLHIARKCRRALIAALTVMALTITPLCALGDAEGKLSIHTNTTT